MDVPTEQTGNFESYSGPRRYIGGNGDSAKADRDSTDFGSLTGDFESSDENVVNPHGSVGATAGTQTAGTQGASQPNSMGSNAGNAENEDSGASSSTPSTAGAGQ